MLFFRHDLKVFNRVIPGVLVLVMHQFRRKQESTEVLLHDETMLHNVSLGVRVRVMVTETSKVSTTATVGNRSLKSRMVLASDISGLPNTSARDRTKLLRTLARAGITFAADKAYVIWRITPSVFQVARTRTKTGGLLSPVLRVKINTAMCALKGASHSFHIRIIAYEERYCEIAVKRLAQSVLPLEIPA